MPENRSPRETLRDKVQVVGDTGRGLIGAAVAPVAGWGRSVHYTMMTSAEGRELAAAILAACDDADRDLAAERRELSERNRRAGGGS